MPRTYVALDVELTGLDRTRDVVVEIGMVKFRGAEVLETFSSLVNPGRALPLKIQQLINLTQEEVDQAPTLRSLRGRIMAFVGNLPIVGHSIDWDLAFLRRQEITLNNLPIDTFELASIIVPEAQRYSLEHLTTMLGIAFPAQHRALPDAIAAKDLFLKLCERLTQCDLDVLQEVAQVAEHSDWLLRQVFRDVLQDRLAAANTPLWGQAPAAKAARKGNEDKPLPPLNPTPVIVPVEADALAEMISPQGQLARSFPGYEHRPEQVEMLRAVCKAFNDPDHLIVEAGTGIGKSLAYLLPAVHFALQNGRRVVISSNTINLQDQLLHKDIPDLQKALGSDFSVAVLKGRSNYICMRRLRSFRRNHQLSLEQARVLAKVLFWLAQTKTGDRAELLLIGNELSAWSDLQSDAETCLGELCPHRHTGECFFYHARERAERTHLVIVNHALLLSDLAMDNRLLPEYEYLIIDEAHHFEEVATDQFGFEVTSPDIYAFLNGLASTSAEAPSGLLSQVPALLHEAGVAESVQQSLTASVESLRDAVTRSERLLSDLFQTLSLFVDEHVHGENATTDAYDERIRLTPGLRKQPSWSDVEVACDNWTIPMRTITQGLEHLAQLIEGIEAQENSSREELLQDIKARIQRGSEITEGVQRVLLKPGTQDICWLTLLRHNSEISLHSAPLEVASALQEKLFSQKPCVVLTSATLRAAGSFSYVEKRLGIEEPTEIALGSPFDYKAAALLYVPNDMPEPNQPTYQRSVERALIELCRATQGRTMALFTSTSQLNNTYRAIQGPLEEEGIVVFAQGTDGSRRQILENFRTSDKAVLLGTRSFWEGVDVVGQALSCLVIVRLPFAVPSDPIFAARSATFEDAFNEYSLPETILRFRQGFGRLIRSKGDYGIVVVLDKRLLTKAYGKTILRSLPPCTARQGPLTALPNAAQRWLDPDNRR